MRTLSIVLSVLAATYFLSLVPRPSVKPSAPTFPKEIQRLSLRSPGLSVTLENVDDQWRITAPLDVPANEGVVVNFLASLRNLTLEEVLSRRSESHALFQTDELSGVHVALWAPDAKEPLTWVIGKDSPSGGHVYVRTGNSNDVHLAAGISRSQAEAGLKMWREPRVLPLAADAVIHSVRVRGAKGTFLVERSSPSWTINGKPADGEKIDRWTTSLRFLTAEEFVDPPESLGPLSTGLDSPETEITLTLESGMSHVLRFGKPEKNETAWVLLRRDTDPHLMWVFSRPIDWLTATEKDLLADPHSPIGAGLGS
jgi:hypothetical protein